MTYDIYKTPQQDFLFQKIFAARKNRDMLIELIEEILGIKIKEIEVIRQAVVDKERKENKEAVLDLQVKVDDESIINVEMQIRDEHNIKQRSLYNGAALLHNEMEAGESYNELKKVVVICILSFELFEEGKYIRRASIKYDDTYEEMTENLQFYYIQIPKFLKQKDKENVKLAQWLYFISQKDKRELKKAMVDNEKVARAQKQLEELLSDKETMEEIRRRRMAQIDRNSIISIAEGRGEKAGKIKIAKKMLEEGMSIEQIKRIAELTEEQIKELQKEDEKQDMEK